MQGWTTAAAFGRSDCERIDAADLAQPVLALTSLTYVAVGIGVLCCALRGRALLAGLAGVTLVAVGVGSFTFHGPQPSWAGPVHDWPIIALAGVCVVGVARSARGRRWAWWAAAAVFVLGLAAYAVGRTGSPLCRPDSLWQYHGVWHVLSSTAAGLAAWGMVPARQYRSRRCR
ncbi:hypothetical protein AU197_18185 [Mycobacterium sp. IS-1590]|uniref:hypothetical protein n=1 Tax=Mycobacterium sp. IS-1590 TaxID=1772286 RepID=UPI000749930D|nr:hypothetical protein [Mycobacterium sp. IS-1590]KUI42044.1 hypothetical protein AU197_18185 [Mycobacterium sp. IS-1590]